eukprot:COSAG01_NODE_15527_length_1327_cov_1.118078_2_plen_235_part_00
MLRVSAARTHQTSGLQQPSTVELTVEWEQIAGTLLGKSPHNAVSARSFATAWTPTAGTLVCNALPLPLSLDESKSRLTYHGHTFAMPLLELSDCLGETICDVEHAVGFVAGLYILSGCWDEAHQLLLGKGSAHHPELQQPGAALKYLHAIVHVSNSVLCACSRECRGERPSSPALPRESDNAPNLLQRIEGVEVGEAGFSGFDNAAYWFVEAFAKGGSGKLYALLRRLGEGRCL